MSSTLQKIDYRASQSLEDGLIHLTGVNKVIRVVKVYLFIGKSCGHSKCDVFEGRKRQYLGRWGISSFDKDRRKVGRGA